MFAQNILFPVSIYFWVYAYLIQAKELVETPFSFRQKSQDSQTCTTGNFGQSLRVYETGW